MEKRLKRSKKERILLGVLGGIAEYLNVDPVLVRLGFLLLFIFNPVAMTIFYFLAAIIMPSEDEEEGNVEERTERLLEEVRETIKSDSSEEEKLIGMALIALGIALIVKGLTPLVVEAKTVLALVLLAIGLLLLLRGEEK
ncbi:PspC domain-containing protein [Thermococcus sp.]